MYTLTRLEITKFSLFIVSIFANPALLLPEFWVLFSTDNSLYTCFQISQP